MQSRSLGLLLGMLVLTSTLSAADVVETAAARGFTTFVAALEAAGLVGTLKGPGPFTVFAPTNEAFAKQQPEMQRLLVSPWSKAKLESIYLYYVVPGKILSQDLATLDSVPTLAGQSLPFKRWSSELMVKNAHITIHDIEASNGVIHGIDAIIFPRPVLQDRSLHSSSGAAPVRLSTR